MNEDNPRLMTFAECQQRYAGGGGSFDSTNTCRVDALGNDETGTFGDLTKPFLTVAAAIAAIEALDPIPDFPVIDIGNNNFNTENLSTALTSLVIVGSNPGNTNNTPFASITFTEESDDITFVLKDCNCYDSTSAFAEANPGTDGIFKVHLINAPLGDVYNSLVSSNGGLFVDGYGSSKCNIGLFTTNASDELHNIPKVPVLTLADGSQPSISNCPSVALQLASGTASINMQDEMSRIVNISEMPAGVSIFLSQPAIGEIFPDSDPLVAGAPYWDGATLKKSAGPPP